MKHSILIKALTAALCLGTLAACTAPTPNGSDTPSATTAPTSEPAASESTDAASDTESTSAADGTNIVLSCTQELNIDKAPARVITMGDDAMSFLWEMGLQDTVVGMGKPLPKDVYGPEVLEALKDVPIIEGSKTEGGGALLSTESLLALTPDIVIGFDSGADREALTKAGVWFYSPDAWCPERKVKIGSDETTTDAIPASFDLVKSEARKYGEIFHQEDKAEALVKKLDGQIEAVKKAATEDKGTAMALYLDEGNDKFFGYGAGSMIQPQFDAVGLKNVYADVKDRLIEGMSMEEVLKHNPQTIVIFYQHGTPEGIINTFKGIAGADQLDAVKNNRILTLQNRFADPPSPNSIRGVEKISEFINQ
ncbi:ABC transporter substrate-binding protein [Stomatohabitans albus]|uniref:ABC transporter substrate-binding protein n=1 Tax=Stomatohabitans albus TaxID=3110766 RepID=UPI00300C1713